MLAVGCLDILVTLPFTLIILTIDIKGSSFKFYQGWRSLHADWQPIFVPKKEWEMDGFWSIFSVKWDEWINPFWSLVFFLLFGTTAQARARYWRVFWFVAKPFGYKPPVKPQVSDVVFGSIASSESRCTGAT